MNRTLCLLTTLILAVGLVSGENVTHEEGEVVVHMFWSKGCPHCATEKPFMQALEAEYPWLEVRYLEISELSNAYLYSEMAEECGGTAKYVPATFICGEMIVGYDSDEATGTAIRDKILECHRKTHNNTGEECRESVNDTMMYLPIIGRVDAAKMSLPLFTVVIGGLDGFNPCAFFVLFFLLSLMIHAQSRWRMFTIGGVFVFFSAFIYFIFMAAWLNLFLLIGQLNVITFVAGLVAIIIAAINIKDFFWFKRGVSLTIPDSARPKLFTRMRNLVKAGELPSMVFGTAMLAIAANAYELLCTAGFPMVYTRVLTLNNLSTPQYYMYLALYNVVYVIPLFVIVLMFTATLGSRKLTEDEGRILKLLSGTMMLLLGLMLVLAPELLNNITAAAGILVLSLAATAIVSLATRKRSGEDKG